MLHSLFGKINNHSKVFAVLSALVCVPQDAVFICQEIFLLGPARSIFCIIIGFPEVLWAMVCGTGCGGNFHGFPGSLNVVGGNLERWFSCMVCILVFLYEFPGGLEVLDRFPGVIGSLIAFLVY